MCGIAGIVTEHGQPEAGLLERMARRLHHRGPDASGVHRQGPAGLAHARLSIIDLSGGTQPMVDGTTGVAVTFNGEIFNYVELRADLDSQGHFFETRSDTEVLLRAYLEWGEACVEHFNGQWAFAVWDPREQRLFASRDRMGIRPFFWARAGEDLVFASEIKALFEHERLHPEVDVEALDDIFTFWTARAPRTFFAGIHALPPGHSLMFRDGEVRTSAYWQLDYPEPPSDGLDESAAIDETAALLTDAVRLRLRADVPVGAYLSGGLDSSLTVGMIRHRTDTPLETFSVTFTDGEFDESEHQRLVVEHNGTAHHTVGCDGSEIGRVFPEVIWHAETPIIRTAPAPLHLLSRLVRENNFKVVVTGEGADEVFGGYDIFKEAKIRRFWRRFPDSRFRPLLLRRLYPYMPALQAQPTAYLKAFFHIEGGGPFFSHTPRWELTRKLKGLFAPEVRSQLEGRDATDVLRGELPSEFHRWQPFCQAQFLETSILLPGYILASQGDRMGMANSVEGRFPFLDHRVVELASRLPPKLKMNVLDEKYLLKRVAEPLVPPAIIERPKQPYRAPDAVSFFDGQGPRFDYVREMLSESAIQDVGVFAPRAVQGLVKKCASATKLGVRDNMALVGVLSTQLAVRRFREEFHG